MNTRYGLIKYSMVQPLACTARHMMLKCILACRSFSSSKKFNHSFYADNKKVESVIGYGIIVGHDMMVDMFQPKMSSLLSFSGM